MEAKAGLAGRVEASSEKDSARAVVSLEKAEEKVEDRLSEGKQEAARAREVQRRAAGYVQELIMRISVRKQGPWDKHDLWHYDTLTPF